MKSKFLSLFSPIVIALVATTAPTYAKVYSPTQFRAALKIKIGTRKGTQAAIQAAALLNVALSDKKNKKNASAYILAVNSAIKKVVPVKVYGDATNRLTKALTVGYFTGIKFNLSDAKYTAALKKLLGALPASQRTQPVSQTIYYTLRKIAASYKVNSGVVYSYYLKVKPGNYPTPTS